MYFESGHSIGLQEDKRENTYPNGCPGGHYRDTATFVVGVDAVLAEERVERTTKETPRDTERHRETPRERVEPRDTERYREKEWRKSGERVEKEL